MSLSLVADIPSTVSSALDDIDEGSTRLNGSDRHHVGPFSVFAATTNEETTEDSGSTPHVIDALPESLNVGSEPMEQETFALGQSMFISNQPASLDFLQWDDLFTNDLQLNYCPLDNEEAQARYPAQLSPEQIDLEDAPVLLKHFHDDVTQQMGSLPINEKSSWRSLNFNLALKTLSELKLLNLASQSLRQACLANLYALIAVSSLHLSLNSANFPLLSYPDTQIRTMSLKAYEIAKEHLRISLETECQGPSRAKYKEQLMATAAVLATAVSFCSGPTGYY